MASAFLQVCFYGRRVVRALLRAARGEGPPARAGACPFCFLSAPRLFRRVQPNDPTTFAKAQRVGAVMEPNPTGVRVPFSEAELTVADQELGLPLICAQKEQS